jgi:F0F1-type ATP synthase assembly protein I
MRGDGKRREPNPLVLGGAAAEMGLVVAALTALGWWADGKLGTRPWLTLAGAAMGIIGGLYNLWRTARRFFD